MHAGFGLPFAHFKHTEFPHYYRRHEEGETELEFSIRMAQALETLIQSEGPDTIAAFFAEPVMEAFASPTKKSELQVIFEREARRLLDNGADVIVPTGGIPMMLFGKEPDANVDGAPIINGVTVVIKAAEMAIKLKRLGVPVASRIPQSGFALPSAQTLDEFMQHG